MQFRIADTFTDSLAKLTGDEQKAVRTTAFDFQLNPANPRMSFHKIDNASGFRGRSLNFRFPGSAGRSGNSGCGESLNTTLLRTH